MNLLNSMETMTMDHRIDGLDFGAEPSWSVPRQTKNPHEPSLGKFLRVRAVPVREGYIGMGNGQIIRPETLERWKSNRTSRRAQPEEVLHTVLGRARGSNKGWHQPSRYESNVIQLRRASKTHYLGLGSFDRCLAMPDRQIAMWKLICLGAPL